jgi:hypothetical protein
VRIPGRVLVGRAWVKGFGVRLRSFVGLSRLIRSWNLACNCLGGCERSRLLGSEGWLLGNPARKSRSPLGSCYPHGGRVVFWPGVGDAACPSAVAWTQAISALVRALQRGGLQLLGRTRRSRGSLLRAPLLRTSLTFCLPGISQALHNFILSSIAALAGMKVNVRAVVLSAVDCMPRLASKAADAASSESPQGPWSLGNYIRSLSSFTLKTRLSHRSGAPGC